MWFLAVVYGLTLVWSFFGIAIISDTFMSAIEVITSLEREVKRHTSDGSKITVYVNHAPACVFRFTCPVESCNSKLRVLQFQFKVVSLLQKGACLECFSCQLDPHGSGVLSTGNHDCGAPLFLAFRSHASNTHEETS